MPVCLSAADCWVCPRLSVADMTASAKCFLMCVFLSKWGFEVRWREHLETPKVLLASLRVCERAVLRNPQAPFVTDTASSRNLKSVHSAESAFVRVTALPDGTAHHLHHESSGCVRVQGARSPRPEHAESGEADLQLREGKD